MPTSEDIYTRAQVFLERYKQGTVNDVLPVFDDLKGLEKIVRRALSSSTVVGDLNKRQLTALLSDVLKLQQKVVAVFDARLQDELTQFMRVNADLEYEALDAAIVTGSGVSLTPTVVTLPQVLQSPIPATGQLLSEFVKGWKTRNLVAANNLIRKGYVNGWTTEQMVQSLIGTKKAGYADGLIGESRRTAESIVRTSVQHVATVQRHDLLSANEQVLDGYQITATLDSSTTTICRSLDGKVFPLHEGPRPPFHVRCRTSIRPKLKKKYAFLEEGGTRSSKDGYVDAKLTYYDWLKKQPAAFQNEALGPTRAKLFRDGGLTADAFARLNLDKRFEPLTLAEMKTKAPAAFRAAGL